MDQIKSFSNKFERVKLTSCKCETIKLNTHKREPMKSKHLQVGTNQIAQLQAFDFDGLIDRLIHAYCWLKFRSWSNGIDNVIPEVQAWTYQIDHLQVGTNKIIQPQVRSNKNKRLQAWTNQN